MTEKTEQVKNQPKIKIHAIFDSTDENILEVLKGIDNIEIVQWDYSFDTAYQWTVVSEMVHIDVFLSSEYAQVSTTGKDGKQVSRDIALLKRVKDLHLMRPKAKFVILCDEDRQLPENRHFLSALVNIGIYDFKTETTLTEERLKEIIEEPKRDVTHIQEYLTVGTEKIAPKFFQKKTEEKEVKAVDIFAMINKYRKDAKKGKKPKVKHIVEKIRPSVVSFVSFSGSDGDVALLAEQYSIKLASTKAKVALIELPSLGVPRLSFSLGMRSRKKTIEAALQRVEDKEDIKNLLITPKQTLNSMPNFEGSMANKLKSLPESLNLLPYRDDAMPHVRIFKNIKQETLTAAPREIVDQLLHKYKFDCIVFFLSGSLSMALNVYTLKLSHYIYCVADQHPGHISWLRQNLKVMEQLSIPYENIRLLLYPYFELNNIRIIDIETALGAEVDFCIPDLRQELLDIAWHKGSISNTKANQAFAKMILESTGHKLDELVEKRKKLFTFKRKAQ